MSTHFRFQPAVAALLLVAGVQAATLRSLMAQTTDRDLAAIASWIAVDAATGYEGREAPALAKALGEWQADRWGNVVATVGSGSPHRIVACALDRPSYAVSQITADGYLRLHRIGRGSRHPLWDQQFEAQQVRLRTASGPVAGVVARSNGHFAAQHARETTPVTADDLWVDVGAESRADVDALGIALLDPVGRHLPPWPIASVLTDQVQLYAVSAHEWSVRRAVLASLPAWARERAVVDDIGNVMVEAGPQGPATVFMAHMDEVGYAIESIAPDGTVTLAAQGGVVASAWEGQTALVHFDPPDAPSTVTGAGNDIDPRWKAQSLVATAPPPLRGVFRIRSAAPRRNPDVMQAWFGVDAEGLAARGVAVGMQVTNYKEGLRLGRTRYTARSLDDRAGTTALVRATNRIDPDRLPGKVIFTWSVHEEGGLRGAAAMARRFGRATTRIYSIDMFSTSDTPLESPHFAFAPLGKGPVLRAIENSSVSPDEERSRVHRAAAAARIPLQIGLTQGGTDGSTFQYWGAPNQGLSWPGRYSHSPGEVLDLRDIEMLTRLIVAVASAGER